MLSAETLRSCTLYTNFRRISPLFRETINVHELSMNSINTGQHSIDVSIIIPTRNNAENIRQCLTAIFSQKTELRCEVLLIDSGSTDGTIAIAREYPVQCTQIQPSEFGHGRTRALGGRLAKGAILVFMTADAYPARIDWLDTLCANLKDANVAGAFSRWVPKPDCNPLVRARIAVEFPPIKHIRSFEGIPEEDIERNLGRFVFFSDVSSAIRKDVYDKHPHSDNCIFGEDQEWAWRVLRAGYSLIYEPRSLVCHSHNDSLAAIYKRRRMSMPFENTVRKKPVGILNHLGLCTLHIFTDVYLLTHQHLTLFRFLKWACFSALENTAGHLGSIAGSRASSRELLRAAKKSKHG